MRLNLPRHNCVRFAISGEFTVDEDSDGEVLALMDSTEGHTHTDDDENTRVAFFGSRFRVAGINHQVRGILYRSVDVNDVRKMRTSITNERASDTLRRPPGTVRPISRLLDVAERMFGEIEVSCTAIFEYDVSNEFSSRVRFPIPLFVQDVGSGISHVEHAEFSRRINDEIEYRVSVSEDSDSLMHAVSFEENIPLDGKSIARLFDRARSISSGLIVQNGGDNHAQN